MDNNQVIEDSLKHPELLNIFLIICLILLILLIFEIIIKLFHKELFNNPDKTDIIVGINNINDNQQPDSTTFYVSSNEWLESVQKGNNNTNPYINRHDKPLDYDFKDN